LCGVLLGIQCFSGNSKFLKWNLEIPKKSVNKTKKGFTKNTLKVDEQKTYKIIQVTDIHLDDKYLIESEAECGEPLCCREINNDIKTKSGKWGTYPCDLPNTTLHYTVAEIAKNANNVDFLYLTGDNSPHDVWLYNRKNSLKISETIYNLFKGLTYNTVIPAIGNHEAVPCDRSVNYFIA
jgi:sphingomyelin phosphodiesterase